MKKINPTNQDLENRIKELESKIELLEHQQHKIDILELQKTEKALKESENFLNSIISQNPYPMWVSDNKGTLIKCNEALTNLLKIEEHQLIGKYNVLNDSTVANYTQNMHDVYTKGKSFTFELIWDARRR